MPPSTIPPHLITFLASPQTPNDAAIDALEEWILHRRVKGDTLFEVSVGLAELEDRTPPHLSSVFDRARYVTNVPQPSDLTPPMGPFPLARSASPATILHHLLSQPTPTIQHSREVILEFCLAREQKHREKKPGRGGKGTLGRDGFEDVGAKLAEVEHGLRVGGGNDEVHPRSPYPSPMSASYELDEPRKVGLMLVLALRMSLSYFTLKELADQLLLLGVADAERTLVQHIRRRIQGEGRYGVGKELEYVESLTLHERPALRPAFRSARTRTSLPPQPNYPVPLPAPSKSNTIKLLSSFAKDLDEGRAPSSFASYQAGASSSSPAGDRGYFKRSAYSPSTPSVTASSPKTPLSSLPPPLHSPGINISADPNPLANYALEVVSEYLTREKRDYMLKSKWAKSGRDQLGKDLGEIEAGLCLASKSSASAHASTLLPIFLVLRRTFALPSSPLPPSITEPYLDILPAPPDPDEIPFREPTVQSTTATLYVNPRLGDAAAAVVLEELVESEKEKVESAGGSFAEMVEWITGLITSVEKRFPDGSYAAAFDNAKLHLRDPPRRTEPSPPVSTPALKPPAHRRAVSTAVMSGSPAPANPVTPRRQHSRSLSMPMRQSLAESSDDSDDDSPGPSRILTASEAVAPSIPAHIVTSHKQLPALDMLSPAEMTEKATPSTAVTESQSSGWWDVVSAVEQGPTVPAPWQEDDRRRTSSSIASVSDLPLPPGAEPAHFIGYSEFDKLDLNSPPRGPQPGLSGSPGPPTPPRQLAAKSRAQTIDTSPRQAMSYSPRDRDNYENGRTLKSAGAEATPPNFSRPQTTATVPPPLPPVPPLPITEGSPSAAPGQPHKSRLFSRSLTLKRSKDKENDKEKEKSQGKKEEHKPANNPGRWNRDMVANIMGPPASKP